MKRYEHASLTPFATYRHHTSNKLTLVTETSPMLLDWAIAFVKRGFPRAYLMSAKDAAGVTVMVQFTRLDDRDSEVYYSLFGGLCNAGWEPYAVTSLWHYFRREVERE